MRLLRVRHRSAPWPTGCRWCGKFKSEHLRSIDLLLCVGFSRRNRYKEWTPPTEEQYIARLRARFERVRRSFE